MFQMLDLAFLFGNCITHQRPKTVTGPISVVADVTRYSSAIWSEVTWHPPNNALRHLWDGRLVQSGCGAIGILVSATDKQDSAVDYVIALRLVSNLTCWCALLVTQLCLIGDEIWPKKMLNQMHSTSRLN